MLATAASAEYLPTMPPGSGVFGTAISASASFNDGYHWDNAGTPQDERDIPEHYRMPSAMPGYTAGDALDYHWVWVSRLGDHVTWDMGMPVSGVRVYPCQDHGPYTGPNSEFDEYRVWGSNDMSSWVEATQIALYCDDITNVRTHDGVKDYEFATPYRYCKITSWIDSDFELDAVEVLEAPSEKVNLDIKPQSCPNPLNVRAPKDYLWTEADESSMAAKARPDGPQKAKAVLPVAILGTADFDVADIDPTTVMLEGVPALRWNIEDVSTPVGEEAEECECTTDGADGYADLTLKFDKSLIVEALGEVYNGDTVSLTMTGELSDGAAIEGTDCVVIRGGDESDDGGGLFGASPSVTLLGNYPNPFNPTTEISFNLPSASHVKLEVFNVMGQKVATLVNGQFEAGEHVVQWDGRDAASGVYFYRLQADDFVDTKKMMLLK